MKKNRFVLFVFILTLAIGYNFGMAADQQPDYWPTKGWKAASPESQGMDSDLLHTMLNMIWETDIDIHSVLVVRNGYMLQPLSLLIRICCLDTGIIGG